MVNRWKDLLDRVAWTALQAGAAEWVVSGFTFDVATLKVAGGAAAIAAAKVVIAQRTSKSGDGSAIPGGIQDR